MVDDLLTGDLLPEIDDHRLLDVVGEGGDPVSAGLADRVADETAVFPDYLFEIGVVGSSARGVSGGEGAGFPHGRRRRARQS